MSEDWRGSRLFSAASDVLRRESMRPVVRALSGLHARLYRLTGGRAQAPKYPTLLLTVRGRKSGEPRTVPLVYVMDGDCYVVAAAYSGAEKDPVWWLNLRDAGEALVEVGTLTVPVRVDLAPPADRGRLWRELVAMYPYFTEYQRRTAREFPIVVLTPVGLDGAGPAAT